MSSKIQPRRTPNTQQAPRPPPPGRKPTGSSESKSRHGSSKVEDARPSRSPLHEKQRTTRVAELEAKLGEALEEIEKLRGRLVAVESSKREVQQELEESKMQNRLEKRGVLQELDVPKEPVEKELDVPMPSSLVTDVFEVVPVVTQMDRRNSHDGNEAAEESDKKMGSLIEENGGLKKELEVVRVEVAAVGAKLAAVEVELRVRSELMERQGEHLEAAEATKAALQEEMKRVCVRSDQWRKAAEEALAALYGGGGTGVEMEGVLVGLENGRWKGMFGDRKRGQ